MTTAEQIRAALTKEKWTCAILWFSQEEGLVVTNRTGWPILKDKDFPRHELEGLSQAIVAGGKFGVRTKIKPSNGPKLTIPSMEECLTMSIPGSWNYKGTES